MRHSAKYGFALLWFGLHCLKCDFRYGDNIRVQFIKHWNCIVWNSWVRIGMTYIGIVCYALWSVMMSGYGMVICWHAMVWYLKVLYGMTWYGMAQYAMVWSVMMTGAARGKLQEVTG